jgi:hypothetical protein
MGLISQLISFWWPSRSRRPEVATYTVDASHGLVGDKHYTDCVETIKHLKREGRHTEAIELLLKTVAATERESEKMGPRWVVAPWYYEQLAIIYRKEGRIEDEIAILERYVQHTKTPKTGEDKLRERLKKAKALSVKCDRRP